METVGTLRRLSAPMAWLLALAALLAPPAASAQDAGEPAQPIFTPAEASAQLDQAVEALSATDPAAAHPTDELRDLTAPLALRHGPPPSAPSSHDRRRTRSRATSPSAPSGRGRERDDPRGANFIVHWPDLPCSAPSQGCDEPDLTDLSGSPAPDYIDQVADAAEESFDVENGALGWPARASRTAAGAATRRSTCTSPISTTRPTAPASSATRTRTIRPTSAGSLRSAASRTWSSTTTTTSASSATTTRACRSA